LRPASAFSTLIGSLLAQLYLIRRTGRDTEKTIDAGNAQLTATIAEEREKLEMRLAAERTRTLTERFSPAADRMGSDKPADVRLAGVHAMAGLADDWPENRQTCVDVLCGSLRMPYAPDPGESAAEPDRLAFQAAVNSGTPLFASSPRTSGRTLRCRGRALTSTSPALSLMAVTSARQCSRAAGYASLARCSPAARSASAELSSRAAG
jgi:hypothetical protein